MFRRAIDARAARRGSALVSSMVVFVGLFGLLYLTIMASTVEMGESRRNVDDVRVQYIAQAGVERGMQRIGQAAASSPFGPLGAIVGLFDEDAPVGSTVVPWSGDSLTAGGASMGEYTVSMTLVSETEDTVVVQIDATGYLPAAPGNLAPGQRLQCWHAISATVEYDLQPSEVFDYAYFINNWGWFYGNSIEAHGNVRSNGQFDVAGYAPLVAGQPTYDGVVWDGLGAHLLGYRDDNEDGLDDGGDGGVWSGWDIVDADNLRGVGGQESNQHDFQSKVEMPNLSDLSPYEVRAVSRGSSVSIGGTQMSNAVYGDEPSELQNLYLIGTAAEPIVLDGPIVARGDVIIGGYVTGQGAIYAGGNVYVPKSIRYVDGPTTALPAGSTQAETEEWLTANGGKDFLGLFAAENIVVGDHTNSTWRHYVSGWMASSLNQSKEDAGEDGIPNTSKGRDGVLGTADDDVLEGDGVWTVEHYSELHEELGLVPDGKSVGDVIPGTGEDIDGDGVYDGTTTLASIDFSSPLNSGYWGGNMPVAGIATYKSIASLYVSNLDATFYTNHSFCYTVLGGSPARINGAVVSRNENIIYGTPRLEFNYDSRLLGGGSGIVGDSLPRVLQAARVLRWTRLERDPHRHQAAEAIVAEVES